MRPTVVFITYNEENIIAKSLKAVKKVTDQILVLDSYSSDRTPEICESLGAAVFQRRFDDYSSQRKFALSLVDSSAWVLMIDADEILSDELILEIQNIPENNDIDAYYIRRVDVFCGKELKYASENLYFPRLFKLKRISISRSINEEYHFNGKTEKLKQIIRHYSFNKGIEDWMNKHIRYASMESQLIGETNVNQSARQIVKRILYRNPLKLVVLFVYYVLVRRGFLDGSRGLLYIYLKLSYELNITLIKWYRRLN